MEDWMGSGWMTSPGGPWKDVQTSHSEMIQHLLERKTSVWIVDLQGVQGDQVYHSLLLDQFDPKHNQKKPKQT